MLELDENTGLRDYDVDYTYTEGSKGANDVREDPYFGKKIAGGCHVSGEASYIKYIEKEQGIAILDKTKRKGAYA